MERVLEGAVEHGAAVTRERLQAYLPADMLLSENARVRGFRLEGYGVFFDVAVPIARRHAAVDVPHARPEQPRDRQRAADAAVVHRVRVAADANVQQAFKRLELQVATVTPSMALREIRDGTLSVPSPCSRHPARQRCSLRALFRLRLPRRLDGAGSSGGVSGGMPGGMADPKRPIAPKSETH